MAGLLSDRKRLLPLSIGTAVLVVVAVAVSLLSSPRGSSTRNPGGTSGSEAGWRSVSASGQPGVATATVVPGSTTPTAGSGTASSTGTSGKEQGTFYITVSWWDDTEEHSAKNGVVTWGESGSWSPDVARRSQTARIGPFPVGRTSKLTVYPDGRAHGADVVLLAIKSSMVSGSERDGIHIEVRDDAVRVLGNPVFNFEVVFPRPSSG